MTPFTSGATAMREAAANVFDDMAAVCQRNANEMRHTSRIVSEILSAAADNHKIIAHRIRKMALPVEEQPK